MTNSGTDETDWESEGQIRERSADDGDTLLLSLDGFEGPLDLLLALSRSKKIDLKALSIAELAEQYISYIQDLQKHRLEIAADYLVMAAWLTFLKSKLLLPQVDDGGESPSGEELAARLAFRLKRLDAMRRMGETLMARPQLGGQFFACGAPQGFSVVSSHRFKSDAFQLFKAYADGRKRTISTDYQVKKREVWSIKKARDQLQRLLGMPLDWAPIHELIAQFMVVDDLKKTTIASTFGATLEMARDGVIKIKQEGHFRPLYVKSTSEDVTEIPIAPSEELGEASLTQSLPDNEKKEHD